MTFFKRTISIGTATVALTLLSCQSLSDVMSGESRIISGTGENAKEARILKNTRPRLLSFKELISLAENPEQEGPAGKKMDELLRSPFIDNSVYFRSGLPETTIHPELGPSLRISTWNIEKSVRVSEAATALASEAAFEKMLRPEIREEPMAREETIRQRAALAASDVLLLQEMDIGHCRSGYLFAAQHLARKLKMNFVYAPQQLEIDPVHLGLDHIHFDNGDTDSEACRALGGKSTVYKGVFGVAVLSRYPIKNVELFQLREQPYDWYEGEIQKPDFLEIGRRKGANALFQFQPIREVKAGGRAFTRVDLHVPGIPLETLSVINVHLEIKATPKERRLQIEEILSYIKGIQNPVVLAGDFNSSSTDVSATSLSRFAKNTTTNPRHLLALGLYIAQITGISQVQGIVNGFKNLRDPLAWNIPVILPNKTKRLFTTIEKFRFEDGGAFDFRGDPERSMHGRSGELSNSNQRHDTKGFTFTYSLPRPIGIIGRQRLDWIFVKSLLTSPKDKKGPYRLAPHFGETLGLVNLGVSEPFSDHHPITTVLPISEPTLEGNKP